MYHIEIVKVSKDNLNQLVVIGMQTFYETFKDFNTEEDLNSYLDQNLSKLVIAKELGNKESAFYFAKHKDEIIGYLKINCGKAQTELKGHDSLEIERIYVSQMYHGRQIGQMLLNKATAIALSQKYKFIWLGVWEKNARAIAFYKKNGFVEFDKHIFQLGNDAQTDIMMKKIL